MLFSSQIFIILISLLGLIIIIFFRSNYEINNYKISKYIISNKIIKNKIKLCFFSDFHNKNIDFDKLVDDIKNLNPDLILIGGDSITVPKHYKKKIKLDYKYLKIFFDKLTKLNIRIIYSFGNHELRLKNYQNKYNSFSKKYDEFINYLKKLNVLILDNQKFTLNENTNIYGLSLFKNFYKNKLFNKFSNTKLENYQIENLLGKLDTSKYNICLFHNPYYANTLKNYGFNLVLSGHYHGGIIRFPFLGCIFSPELELFPKFTKGNYKINDKNIIVTSGLGEHSIKFRLNNFCEICYIEINNE